MSVAVPGTFEQRAQDSGAKHFVHVVKQQGHLVATHIRAQREAEITARTPLRIEHIAAFQIMIVDHLLISLLAHFDFEERFGRGVLLLVESLDVAFVGYVIGGENVLPVRHAVHNDIEKLHIFFSLFLNRGST